ncbi:MAG: DUF169 domain-containing protein [Actinomycetota bacterium]|nr:DUF169 domain-containing protein [Actinomycetota bacterium]
MESKWVQEARELSNLLRLENKPVAVNFTNGAIGETNTKVRICNAIKEASKGAYFVIGDENSLCRGGSWHCGLSKPPEGKSLRALQKFLTEGEKLTSTIVTFKRMQSLGSPPPTGLSERIVICPLEESPERPDLVLFLCNPEQATRLLTLDQFQDGIPPEVEISGSLCHGAIAYSAVTGRTNMTFGDWTARKICDYSPDTVFVTIPYERIANVILSIPDCSAGKAKASVSEDMREFVETQQA